MRLFVGIAVPPEIAREISGFVLHLRSLSADLRWSAPEGWHITLQFLGNIEASRYACVVEHLSQVQSAPVSVQLEGTGIFERAGIFFASVKVNPELLALQQRVTAAMHYCDFIPETRPYHPHITLARGKGRTGTRALQVLQNAVRKQPRFGEFLAKGFLLYESFTEPSGSRYEVCARFPLVLAK